MDNGINNRRYKGVINYFVNYTSIFSLTPWRNSIRLFHDESYKIRVFQYADDRIKKYPSELEGKYDLEEIGYPKVALYILFAVKSIFRSFKHIGLKRLSTIGDGIDCLFRNYYFILACIIKNKSRENEIFIGGDPGSLIAAHYLSKKKKGTLIYWSLELYIEKDLDNFGLKIIKRAERKCNQDALCTVDFGEMRCRILQEENRLDPSTMISIPNSQIGHGEILRNFYFNDKFNIPRNKVIILHAGALFGAWLRVKDIFLSIPEWPDDYVLVLHTHRRPYPGCGFALPEKYLNNKIFLSDNPVPFDQLDMIYSSCDIGIMIHGPAGINLDMGMYFSDLSVGKMFHHLKVGVPLVIRNLPGYQEIFEKRQAGICINYPSDILPGIKRILKNHALYRVNAISIHEEYRFELHHKRLVNHLNSISSQIIEENDSKIN